MAVNRGKEFENKFKDALLSIRESQTERFKDQMTFFHGSKNVCDFMFYKFPNLYYLECKTTKGNHFLFSNLGSIEDDDSQLNQLYKRSEIKGIMAGVVIWFTEKQRVSFIDIKTIFKLIKEGKKSFNPERINYFLYKDFDVEFRNIYPKFTNLLNDLKDIEWQK